MANILIGSVFFCLLSFRAAGQEIIRISADITPTFLQGLNAVLMRTVRMKFQCPF